MKDALDVVMAWQLRNPSATDTAEAIEAVKKARESDSELPQCLASHFLKLTIPPFFPQTKATNTLEVSPKPAPWKNPHNEYVLDLLGWSIRALDRKAIEQNWHLLVPPILKMIDDMEAKYKAKGCQCLTGVLLTLLLSGSHRDMSAAFLSRTGYHEVFASTLWPLFTHIPSLTPEAEALTIFKSVYDPLRSLAPLCTSSDQETKFLDKLMREGVLAPLSHFPTPSTYPDLACEILNEVPEIAAQLDIGTVKHLPSLIPLLTSILQDPFILGHKKLTLAAVLAMQGLILSCWPRIPAHRGAITLALCVLKGRLDEEGWEKAQREKKDAWGLIKDVRKELEDTAELVDIVCSQSEIAEEWKKEKAELVESDERLKGIFEEQSEQALYE
jgi:hypothetical protein